MRKVLIPRPWWWLLLVFILLPLLLFFTLTGVAYWKQDALVQHLLKDINTSFSGEVQIKDSHISPFANFPYISIDLEDLRIYEGKNREHPPILAVQDAYIGFDLWSILSGNYALKALKIKKGDLNLIQHKDGSFNLVNALASPQADVDSSATAPLNFHLDAISFVDVDVHKINEETQVEIELFVKQAKSKFSTKDEHLMVYLDSRFDLNVILAGDTSFIKHKHFDLQTQLDYFGKEQRLEVAPSKVRLEEAVFNLEGGVSLGDEMPIDLRISGAKPNFDLFIALAPEELIPTLRSYGNKGLVFLDATITGPMANGKMPLIEAVFGCEEGAIVNNANRQSLEDMAFSGSFTNGEQRSTSTMEFKLANFTARPGAGIFSGDLKVFNFDSPEIDLKLNSEFNLDFLSNFFNIEGLDDMAGSVALTMNFKDIVDLEHPERSIEKLNESYYTELLVKDLRFRTADFHLPVQNINIKATMEGHEAIIDYFTAQVGHSDIAITGSISDLPAILHHSDAEVETKLLIKSKLLDLAQLTYSDAEKASSINEEISDLSLDLAFMTKARAFTESPNLPVGEFLVRDFNAKLKHYPHLLHDFHADIFIGDEDIRLVDFSGEIDGSDFHFTGKATHYDIWLKPELRGDTKFDFNLTSTHFRLEDLFAYKGENYVPEDYRHEDFRNLRLKGRLDLHFGEKGLHATDLYLDELSANMKVHQARFDRFKGRVHYEGEHLLVESLSGQVGKSDLAVDLQYYLGQDSSLRKRDNFFRIRSKRLDLDELLAYRPRPEDTIARPEDHDQGFNVFELPFTDMRLEATIGHLNYHRYLIDDLQAIMRMQQNHYVYLDECRFAAADGLISLKGYFNGSNPKEIYFSPDMAVEKINLDKLLFKFENFGQDHIVAENLHGTLSGQLNGKVRMHTDLTPIIDQSELHMDIKVVKGRLENYTPLQAISSYFKDKNLNKVLFDTLSNTFDIKNGKMDIPWMSINSSLGFIELSGQQDLDMNMRYYFKIPLQLVTKAAFQRLFKRKREEVDLDHEDEILTPDPSKKIRYVNVKLEGNTDNYSISLGKGKVK